MIVLILKSYWFKVLKTIDIYLLSQIVDIRFVHGICDSCIEENFLDLLELWNEDKLDLQNKQNSPEC